MKNKINKILIVSLITAQTISLCTTSYAAPQRILGRDRIMKWDYHRTNYDSDGEIRIKPKTTLFDTENEGRIAEDLNIPKVSTLDTLYGNDVEILVDSNHENSSIWLNNIYKITKKDTLLEDNPNLESTLQYKITDGKIILKHSSRSIDMNGLHNIKIYSKDFSTKIFPIHIIEKASIVLMGNTYAHQDVLFKLEDFNYSITNPIYEVILDGKVLKGKCDEYHIVSDIIRLENNILNDLTPGKHTLIVKAIGYETLVKDFYLDSTNGVITSLDNQSKDSVPTYTVDENLVNTLKFRNKMNTVFNSNSIDAISSSTKNTGSKDDQIDGVSSATGSLIQNVDLVFDFDLVANSIILDRLNQGTNYSKKVFDRWNSAIIEYIQNDEDDNLYTWTHYKDSVNKYKLDNQYLSFQDYIKNDPKTTKNRGYSYKFVLEDGLLGDVQRYNQIDSIPVKIKELSHHFINQSLKLTVDNLDFLNNLEEIHINNTKISNSDYKINGNTIYIYNNSILNLGNNNINIISTQFDNQNFYIYIYKNPLEFTATRTSEGLIISGLDKDFKNNFKYISINGTSLFNKSQVGSDEDYRFKDNDILVYENIIKDLGIYNIEIASDGYLPISLKYLNNDNTIGDIDIDKPIIDDNEENPETNNPTEAMSQGLTIEDNQDVFSSSGNFIISDNYNPSILKIIKSIKINDISYPLDKLKINKHFYYNNKGNLIFLDTSYFNKYKNEVIIEYKDLETTNFIALGKISTIVEDEKDIDIPITEDEKQEDLSPGIIVPNGYSISSNGGQIIINENFDKEILDKIKSIRVNHVDINLNKDIFIERSFFKGGNIRFIDYTSYFTKDENIVTIEYEGYKDTKFTVIK